MSAKNTLVRTLGPALIAGCAASVGPAQPTPAAGPTPPTTSPSSRPGAAGGKVDENLASLRALAVFEVGQLIVDAPEGAYNCYGPCPEHKGAIDAATEKSAARLERLVAAATAAEPDRSPATCEPAAIDANLQALRDLRIVEVGRMIEDRAEARPNCYGQPCPNEVEVVKARNCERAGKLSGIAAAAKSL